MSRIRQIKPSWFLDKALRRGTNADAREFYIGLWMLADDAGYLVWDVERIAAELYPYNAAQSRERHVISWANALMALDPENPHLIVWDCGHARVPKMPDHQRIAGNRTLSVRRIHVGDPGHPPPAPCRAASSVNPLHVATVIGIGTVGNGTVRNGSARARKSRATESLKEGVARHGYHERTNND